MRNYWIYRRVLRKGHWSQEEVASAYSREDAKRKAELEQPYHGETTSRVLIAEVSDTKLMDMRTGEVIQDWHGDGYADLIEALTEIRDYPSRTKSDTLSGMARRALERNEK